MKRTSKLNKSYEDAKSNVIDKNKKKVSDLKKKIAYEEMREVTGTKNKQSLIKLMNKAYDTDDIGQAITAGGALYGE